MKGMVNCLKMEGRVNTWSTQNHTNNKLDEKLFKFCHFFYL